MIDYTPQVERLTRKLMDRHPNWTFQQAVRMALRIVGRHWRTMTIKATDTVEVCR